MPSRRSQPPLNLYAALAGEPVPTPRAPATKSVRKSVHALSESAVQKLILSGLRIHPKVAWVGRYNSGGMYGSRDQYVQFNNVAGQSDLMGMLKGGRLLAIEVKRPGGVATEAQQRFLDRINAGGGIGIVATGWDDVARALEETA